MIKNKINQNYFKKIASSQNDYYSNLFKTYAYSPLSVGSENLVNKKLRYIKLSEVFSGDEKFSLHDIGHGLGHYYEFLKHNYPQKKIKYSGSEVCKEFVVFCKKKYPQCDFWLRNLADRPFKKKYDYIVFGGTFYHKEKYPEAEWKIFLESMLINAFKSINKGFSFNLITFFCDYFKNDLFYCDPGYIINFIVKNLSRFFVLDHTYPLYEYTICVYKEEYIKSMFPEKELGRYFKK